MTRGRLAFLAQFAVSLVLLLLLARKVPVDELRDALGRVRPGTLALGLGLALVAYIGRAQRWKLLLRRCEVPLPLVASYRLTLVGTFYGLFTPGRFGEFARVLHMRAPRSATLPSVVWDRLADVLMLEALCLPAFLAVPAWRGAILGLYLAIVAVTLAGLGVLASPGVHTAAARRIPVFAGPIGRWAGHSRNLLAGGMSAPSFLWGAFFYAFSFPAAWLLLRDLAPDASPKLMLGLPLLPLLGNLPIALGGLGLREQVSATLFERYHVGAANGAVFSLLWFLVVTLAPAVIGFALSLVHRTHADDAGATA